MKRRLAIIGASSGQLPVCLKAKEMGLETFCFAWPEGAVCKEYVDHFIPVSIMEMDEIVRYCKAIGVDGVVSNASETTALTTSYVAEKLGKNCTPYETFKKMQDKSYVRSVTNTLSGISPVDFCVGTWEDVASISRIPYVVKPVKGASKIGVNFIDDQNQRIIMPKEAMTRQFIAEAYIEGKEYSVESMSYHGQHQVVQITEKVGSGPPHFVELEHHQPAFLSKEMTLKINCLIPKILTSLGYKNGASHIEIKINSKGEIFLVEVNPRGAGGHVSDALIRLSTDCDYIKWLILISLDEEVHYKCHNIACSGIYFLTAYTSRLLPYFDKIEKETWMVERKRYGNNLTNSVSNYDRDGYIIYCDKTKVII